MKSKTIIIISVIAIMIAVIFFLYKRKKNKAEAITTQADQAGSTAGKATIKKEKVVNDADYPWVNGTYGPNVLFLQKGLNAAYRAGLSEDGIFGPKTQTALKKYLEIDTIKSAFNLGEINNIINIKLSKKP
jgi:peptidoglycan hydrolase-like protein with peptidoglycan-binding domain